MDAIQEATDLLKKLSPANQAYLMVMARVARAAEDGARRATGPPGAQPRKGPSPPPPT